MVRSKRLNIASVHDGLLPPLPSRSTRKISMRSRMSTRGFIIAHLPADDFRPRRIYFESKLERSFALLMLARRTVYDLQEQPTSIQYQDQDGKLRKHSFDFAVTTLQRKRVAVIVKNSERAETQKFKNMVVSISAQFQKFGYHQLVVYSDHHTNDFEINNAERLHHFRHLQSEETTQRIENAISRMGAGATVNEFLSLAGDPLGGFGAILQAYFDGLLTSRRSSIITMKTPLFKVREEYSCAII